MRLKLYDLNGFGHCEIGVGQKMYYEVNVPNL